MEVSWGEGKSVWVPVCWSSSQCPGLKREPGHSQLLAMWAVERKEIKEEWPEGSKGTRQARRPEWRKERVLKNLCWGTIICAPLLSLSFTKYLSLLNSSQNPANSLGFHVSLARLSVLLPDNSLKDFLMQRGPRQRASLKNPSYSCSPNLGPTFPHLCPPPTPGFSLLLPFCFPFF